MNIWTSIDSPAVLAEFEARLNYLKMTPFSKLKELPEHSDDTAKMDDRYLTFTTYRRITKKNDLEIVLKISISSRKLLLTKVAYVFANGFCITPSGAIQPLPKETLYEYM
jgi:hypothetical protein